MTPHQARQLIRNIRAMREDNTPPDAIVDSVLVRLKDFAGEPRGRAAKRKPAPPDIVAAVAECCAIAEKISGVPTHQITGGMRQRSIVTARYAVMQAVWRTNPQSTLMSLAAAMGRDHSTVHDALNKRRREIVELADKIVRAVVRPVDSDRVATRRA